MKPNELVFVRNYNLRSGFDLLHLKSIEYLGGRSNWRRSSIEYSGYNVGVQERFMVWAHVLPCSRELVDSVHVRKYWKRKRSGVMTKRLKVNPTRRSVGLHQARAGAVSVGEYYDFFLTRAYRNRRKRRRWDFDITLDEFFLFFEQYDIVPRFSGLSHELSVSLNFDSILTFWPTSFVHIALQNARYPFWIYGGNYVPFLPFGGFAQITNHCIDADSVEPDYWFGARAKGVQHLVDPETRLEFFVVIFCWGFLFDFRGPRMFEAQFGVGFLSAMMLAACLRADRCAGMNYASDDWVSEDNEETSDVAPVSNWITRCYTTYLFSRNELGRMWDEFSIDFWKTYQLNFSSKYSKLFSNDLARIVKILRCKILLGSFSHKISINPVFFRFTEMEVRFFSYNNFARPSIVFLRLLPKVICFFNLYAQFCLHLLVIFICRLFTINVKNGLSRYNYVYNCVNYLYSYNLRLSNLLRQSGGFFYFRVFLIFLTELVVSFGLLRPLWSLKLTVLVGRVFFYLCVLVFFYFLLKGLMFFYLMLIFGLAVFAVSVVFRLESDNVRADKFSFFESGFKMFNTLYLWFFRIDILRLVELVMRPFLLLLIYIVAVFNLGLTLFRALFKNLHGGYLSILLYCSRSSSLLSIPASFTLTFVDSVGFFEYLCFWFRSNLIKVNPRFRLVSVLDLISLVEFNWLVINFLHLFCGATGWWVFARLSEFGSKKWRETFEFNNIRNSAGGLSGSFFTAFGLRGLSSLSSFGALFLEILFFRLAIPYSTISSKLKKQFVGRDLSELTVILNDLFTNTLFLNSWGVFRRTHFNLNDFVLADVSFLNIWNLLGYFFRGVFSACLFVLKKFCTLTWYIYLLLVYTLIYIILIIFMVYLVILTATLLYICGIKAGLSIILYISLKIIVVCLILSVMRRKE